MKMSGIRQADGAAIRPAMLEKENRLVITEFGASQSAAPKENTRAVNAAINAAAEAGGGTVVVPSGTFYMYTIKLQSNVNLFLEQGAVVAAAKPSYSSARGNQAGEGGNYGQPEVNPYVGIQDHGHSYFANSLVYGADLENIMIYGQGLFTGGRFDGTDGTLEYVLQGGDPKEPRRRDERGHQGEWFGNKGLALVRCRNVVFKDFSVTIGGHFAVIMTGCENVWVEGVLLDTTRDAFDIDCCQDVTVRHTICNSLTDDGLCLKASFGAGIFKPLKNVLIEECTVMGYDAGSVYAGEYTRDKLVAADRCGPTARVKFGTEATCGGERITVRRVKFERSRGFCLEAVDCSPLTDVILEDCTMENVSSSPIFIRAGDRGRFPVTGKDDSLQFPPASGNVRLDNPGWVLPDSPDFERFPVRRFAPGYNRTRTVTVDGHSFFEIIDEENPVRINPANCNEKEIPPEDLPLFANAVGGEALARVENVLIRNVQVTNADPRYPILLMGLTDSHLKNIVLENVSVEYRGGLSMEHAVEQRQLNTEWKFSQFHAPDRVQNIPWLVNDFFLKNEGLLPRVDWDAEKGCWRDDPYNVPELPEVYPEPSNWGILPAYGIFVKHVDGLTLRNLHFTCKVPDGRHVCVLDDADGVRIDGMDAFCAGEIAPVATVTHHYRRHTNAENVPGQPYFTTEVKALDISRFMNVEGAEVANIEVKAPAPGTPRDKFYDYPTVPCRETGYAYARETEAYPLPLTVHRPFIQLPAKAEICCGEPFSMRVTVRCPAAEVSERADDGIVYGEAPERVRYSVGGMPIKVSLRCGELPEGAVFDAGRGIFSWTPSGEQTGVYEIMFIADDGVIPETGKCRITVL